MTIVTSQYRYDPSEGGLPELLGQLTFAFGERTKLGEFVAALNRQEDRSTRGGAHFVVGCSTAGDIEGSTLSDSSVKLTSLSFESSSVQVHTEIFEGNSSSRDVGERLVSRLIAPHLKHIIVLSEGLIGNGTELVKGIRTSLPPEVTVSGGLAADGDKFQVTCILAHGELHERGVVGIGLYGEKLHVGCGSFGGWMPFGPERLVTRSSGNVLFELDGESALALYRRYLGPTAIKLSSKAFKTLLFLRIFGSASF